MAAKTTRRPRTDRRPLIDRLADDLEPITRRALEAIAPHLYDGDESLGPIAESLADFQVATVRVVLEHVAPYREA